MLYSCRNPKKEESNMKTKQLASLLVALVLLLALPAQAFACTTIYAGSNLTADGSVIFGRSEDYSSDATDPTYEEYPTDDTGYDSSTDYNEATESTDYSYDYSVDTNDYGEPDYGYYGE